MYRERLVFFSSLCLAALLVLSGVLLASGGALPEHTGIARAPSNAPSEPQAPSPPPQQNLDAVRPVSPDDHIYGSPQAPVTLIEYSDLECPFCAQVHPTLARVVDESKGAVRWVYRHYPLTSIHPRAFQAAVASECVAALKQNAAAFWIFADALFSSKNLSEEALIAQAREQGIDAKAFAACMASPEAAEQVNKDMADGNAVGVRGTPYIVVIGPSGATAFSGARPIEAVRAAIAQVQ